MTRILVREINGIIIVVEVKTTKFTINKPLNIASNKNTKISYFEAIPGKYNN